jgi:hypothetical protein
VLKAPAHLFALDALLSAFPDARIVQLHRHPLIAMPSWASLVAMLRGALSRHAEPRAIAQEQAALWAVAATRAVGVRDRQGVAGHIIDLTYDELVRDPLPAVRRIYHAFGLPLTPDAQAAMRRYLAVRPCAPKASASLFSGTVRPRPGGGAAAFRSLLRALQLRRWSAVDGSVIRGKKSRTAGKLVRLSPGDGAPDVGGTCAAVVIGPVVSLAGPPGVAVMSKARFCRLNG